MHAEIYGNVSFNSTSNRKVATEIPELQKTPSETREVEEFLLKGQKGFFSLLINTYPIGSENVTGLARVTPKVIWSQPNDNVVFMA